VGHNPYWLAEINHVTDNHHEKATRNRYPKRQNDYRLRESSSRIDLIHRPPKQRQPSLRPQGHPRPLRAKSGVKKDHQNGGFLWLYHEKKKREGTTFFYSVPAFDNMCFFIYTLKIEYV
jgi:hypothetical protein